MMIEVMDVTKSYDNQVNAVDGVNLLVEKGEFVTLIGPSGCGKTTLLKMINRLIDYDKGDILVEGKSVRDWDKIELRRSIGYVIQQVGLFPHMTIEDNISYVLSLQKVNRLTCRQTAESLIELIGLDKDVLRRYPAELSGGQKQRIGVARALAANPDIVLMDEPFGAVDEIARTSLQDELLKLQKKLKKTILFVTHDIQEALKLGDKVVLMREGQIEQAGSKESLLFEPVSPFVKEFIGLKGFKSILDNQVFNELYEKVISQHLALEDIYQMILK